MRWLVMVAVMASACGGSSPASPDAPPPIDAAPDAAPFVMTGQVTDSSGNPIAGAQVCILDHPALPCSSTDANGAWSMAVPFLPPPPAVEIATSFTATGYLGNVYLADEATPGAVGYVSVAPLLSDAEATTLLATQAGFTYPSTTTGFVQVRIHGPAGATAALSPASGTGPVYTRADGTPDPTLTSTQATDAEVYFGNVAPGKYDIAVTAPGVQCHDGATMGGAPIAGDWPPTGSGTLGIEVAAGTETGFLHAYCF